MAAYRQEQDQVVVAVASSAMEAQIVQMTLAAHGITAVTSAPDPAHPSLDFVQGVRVFVAAEDEAEARSILG